MAEDKKFTYKGKTVEELKAMSLEEFTTLLPSDLKRKVSRGFTEQEKIFLAKFKSGAKNIKTHCRDMIVLPEMIGEKISIYSGKEFVQINIADAMIAMRFGQLVPTRKIASHAGGSKKATSVRK